MTSLGVGEPPARRATIRDVARRAGVSAAAVSFTFSGKPGVSPATRRRIEAAAATLDWRPRSRARPRAAGHGGTVALAAAHPPRRGQEFAPDEFLAGALGELGSAGHPALLAPGGPTVVRRWWQAGQICGAIVLDAGAHGAAAAELAAGGVAAVTAAPAHPALSGGPTVWWDDDTAAATMLGYLAALGHRRIGYIADQAVYGRLAHLQDRATAHGVEVTAVAAATGRVAEAARVTRSLLSQPHPPTALLYDSAAGAVTGLGVAGEMAFAVPRSLSILAWQDSLLCTLTRPRITALTHGAADLGVHAVRTLLALLDHRPAPPMPDAALQPLYRDTIAPVP